MTLTPPVDLAAMIGHRESVQTSDPLENVHKAFLKHQFEYMAVLEGKKLAGLCSRKQVAMILGGRFGFSMFSRRLMGEMMLPSVTQVRVNEPLPDVLQKVFTRPDDIFFDDILLVDEHGLFAGLIFARNLVRLQHALLRANISKLEAQQKELNSKNEEMINDLRMAGEIQQALLPHQYPSFQSLPAGNQATLHFYHRYEPSGGVSGDLFHVFPINSHQVGVFICDVMGHGVRSAFVTAMLRTLVQELGHLGDNPGKLLTRINCELKAILKQTGDLIYATAFYLIYDINTGVIRYARASHPRPLWLQRNSGAVTPLHCPAEACGPALGFFDNSHYETIESTIPPGDAIFFVTDGLFELFDAGGNEFGEKRLAQEIQKNRRLGLKPLMDHAYDEALNFTENRKFDDDVCFLGMEIS